MQCLSGERKDEVKRLIITASGGSFRNLSRDELANVTKDDALKPIGKAAGYTAIGAGAATAGALVARKAIKHHKAKKEAEARRRRSLRGRLSGRR